MVGFVMMRPPFAPLVAQTAQRSQIFIQGMGGQGDCLHQRAIVRQLMKTYDVILATPWPAMYHDLIEQGLKVVRRPIGLRTQSKNMNRDSEAAKYSAFHPFSRAGMQVSYLGQEVMQTPSKTVLEVMCNKTGTSYAEADYRLPIPHEWTANLDKKLGSLPFDKPWMVHRPLCIRPEWRGGTLRNADAASYNELFNSIRDQFFVISVADLLEGQEWIVPGSDIKADLSFHHGELVFEDIAALFHGADLIFTASGFPAILGPAVETPTISIIGGYEDVHCHDSGAKFAPYLAIGPRVGCHCWTQHCQRVCDKSLDMDAAKASVLKFVSQHCIQTSDEPWTSAA
jgi:hypothetical protein